MDNSPRGRRDIQEVFLEFACFHAGFVLLLFSLVAPLVQFYRQARVPLFPSIVTTVAIFISAWMYKVHAQRNWSIPMLFAGTLSAIMAWFIVL